MAYSSELFYLLAKDKTKIKVFVEAYQNKLEFLLFLDD
jgi:hypothetical protein